MDDDEQVRKVTARVVSQMGHPCVTVSSGEEVVGRLEKERFDIIPSDIAMEGMSGITFMERAKERDPDLDFIIMTAYTSGFLLLVLAEVLSFRHSSYPCLLSP